MRTLLPVLFLPLAAAMVIGTFAPRLTATYGQEAVNSHPRTGHERPVLVELFTSEGCSSCPPADSFLLELEKARWISNAEVIVLGEHVDYWNRLGWVDPFSSGQYSDRQTLYSRRFGKVGVYTPQMVVDGREELVGSDRSRALQVIAEATRQPKAEVSVALSPRQPQGGSALAVAVQIKALPAVSPGDSAEVILAVTEGRLTSQVTRGENTGRKLSHAALVRRFLVLGRVDAGKGSFSATPEVRLEPDWKTENLKVVVFVQEHESKHVLGTGSLPVGPRL